MEHCSKAFTGHLDRLVVKLTRQERRLRVAVEGVLRRVCGFGTNTLGEALDLLDKFEDHADSGGESGLDKAEGRKMLERWRDEVERLMDCWGGRVCGDGVLERAIGMWVFFLSFPSCSRCHGLAWR